MYRQKAWPTCIQYELVDCSARVEISIDTLLEQCPFDPPRVRFPYDAIFLCLRKDHQKATVTVYIHDDFGNEDSDNLQLSRQRLE